MEKKKGRFTVVSEPSSSDKSQTKSQTKSKGKKPRKKDNESLRIKVLKVNAREEQKNIAINKVLGIEDRIDTLNLDIISLDETRFKKKKEILMLNKELIRMTQKYAGLFPGRS
jgi:hypothetical protein